MARIGASHLFLVVLLLSAVLSSDSARVPRERPGALPAAAGHGQPAMAEMTVPAAGEGQSRGPGFGVAAHESKRLSPGGMTVPAAGEGQSRGPGFGVAAHESKRLSPGGMTVPAAGEGQSRGPGFGVAAHESKRLSPGGPDPQHH